MRRFCPSCGKETEWEKVIHPIEMDIRGENIVVEAEYYRCGECQAEYEDLNSNYDPYNIAYEEYRRRKGMVQPAQIREFRKRYDLTQKELSKLLGLGDVTLSRYENGALQDKVHDKLLQLVMDPQNLLRITNEKPYALSDEKRSKLLKKLHFESPILNCVQAALSKEGPNEFNGYKVLDLKKVSHVIKYFCYNREVFKTKLFKLLFYVDFNNFKLSHCSITGLQYAHLPFGPVPDNYELVIGSILQSDPTISMQHREIAGYIGETICSFTPPDISIFSEEERAILNEVNTKFEDYTSKKISTKTHAEKGYQETPNGDLITYSYAADLNI